MARKPDFEKRRKEQAPKQTQEEKLTRKREGNARPDDELTPSRPAATPASPQASPTKRRAA